ncbi:MAG: S8 family serine peptidase, partial [Deltaproteobacteria bacterium]|nr:S8 family serine peptidase [Deltaproteobacteria bacterium]
MKFEPSIKASHPRGSGDLVNSLDSPANTARRAWRFRGNDIRVILVAALVIMCGIFASCGSDNLAIAPSGNLTIEPDNLPINLQVDSEAQGIASSAAPSSATTTPADRRNDKELNGYWHKFVYSDNYTGEIAVMFKDGTDMRDYLPTEDVRRGVQRFTEEQVNEAIERAGRRGIALNNWSQFFIIKERDPARAEAILVELANSRAVKWVQPHLLPQLSDAGSTANIVEDQDYLYPNETHGGLNVVAGWEAGAYGEDIVLADLEINWNFTHEDLGIAEADICYDDGELPSNPSDAKYVNHGTAVVGILSGSDNGIGIDGIASKAKIKLFKGSLAVLYDIIFGLLPPCSDGTTFKPGDVIVIELQMKGNIASKCDIGDLPSGTATGCVPMEAWPEFYDFVADAVKLGYVIIEGAGNGAVDLGSPEAHIESGPDLSIDNSGAIMVGASMGANHEKAWYSNCGNRLDVYAWGTGVVTTGYGDHPASDPSDPNKWYTKQFDGTSSATAIIGGVAAQLQSYVKKVYAPNARLTPKQMKDLLIASGVPAVGDENCNIGVQPDVGKAIEMLNNGTFAPEFEVLPLDPASEDVVSGIRYDMDGDGRAELISFSRDHKWYIDLSSTKQGAVSGEQFPPEADQPSAEAVNCEESADGYCAWDVILTIPSPLMGEGNLPADGVVAGGEGGSEDAMLFPVVHDYNSDGRADLALYDSINGKYYIKYTTNAVITPSPPVGEGGGEGAIEWDRIIDYTADPAWKAYSRPVPGDYDGDNWLDTALQTPDGHWLIDYGGFDGVKLSPPPQPSPLEGEGKGGGAIAVQFLDHFGS